MISDKEVDKLKRENEELKKALEEERLSHEKTKKDFEEFKAKHSVTVENLKKAMKIKPSLKKESTPLGAPKGHKGYTRHIPKRIDKIKALNPLKCPHCHTRLGKTQEIRQRHVTDIKLVAKSITTKYDIHRKYCTKCKKLVEKQVPNALPNARFGLNLMLLVMYLKLGLRLPCNKICDFFMTIYSVSISEGEIIVILRQLANAYGDYYSTLEKIVKKARVKYTDSTGWRINAKNYFAWVFIATGIVLYKIRKRNNHRVGLALFGKKQNGKVLVVDRHSAHRTLAEKSGFVLQFCWSHLIRNSKDLARDFGCDGKYVHKRLKQIYALAKAVKNKGNTEILEQLKGEILELGERHYKSLTVWKFVKGLKRDIDGLFRFVTDPEIDSTNNISERELRALVIIRKISNGSRSRRGANASAMLLSIIQTLRFQKKNVLEGLCQIINNPSDY